MTSQREGRSVNDLERLEDPVTYRDAVVESRDTGILRREDLPVQPDRHTDSSHSDASIFAVVESILPSASVRLHAAVLSLGCVRCGPSRHLAPGIRVHDLSRGVDSSDFVAWPPRAAMRGIGGRWPSKHNVIPGNSSANNTGRGSGAKLDRSDQRGVANAICRLSLLAGLDERRRRHDTPTELALVGRCRYRSDKVHIAPGRLAPVPARGRGSV